ncbi:MAG: response regulator [Bacteroidales bacterium]|jgi:CheY-like chemotaxis protein|nr:response regulator [Bacteroidales bacterium]
MVHSDLIIIISAIFTITAFLITISCIKAKRKLGKLSKSLLIKLDRISSIKKNFPVEHYILDSGGHILEKIGREEDMHPRIKQDNNFFHAAHLMTGEIRTLASTGTLEKRIINLQYAYELKFERFYNKEKEFYVCRIRDIGSILDKERASDSLKKIIHGGFGLAKIGFCEYNLYDDKILNASDIWKDDLHIPKNATIEESFDNLSENERKEILNKIDTIRNAQFNEESYKYFSENYTREKSSYSISVSNPGTKVIRYYRFFLEIKKYDPDAGKIILYLSFFNMDGQTRHNKMLEAENEKIRHSESIKRYFIDNIGTSMYSISGEITSSIQKLLKSETEEKSISAAKKIEEDSYNLISIVTNIIEFALDEKHGDADSNLKGRKKRILIAEEDPSINKFLREMLETQYDILIATNGIETLDYFKRFRPDYLLADNSVSLINGTEIANIIKKAVPDFPIIGLRMNSYSDSPSIKNNFDMTVADPIIQSEDIIKYLERN